MGNIRANFFCETCRKIETQTNLSLYMEHDGTIPRNPARNFFLLSRFDAAQSSSVDFSPHVVTGAMMCFFSRF